MNLKNYTTEVPASRSIGYIEDLLIDFGASNINKTFENGTCSAISFIIKIDNNNVPFRLPVNVKGVFIWLRKKKPSSKEGLIMQQAERIAWKQQHELLHIQLSLIETGQMEKMEALLPFLMNIATDKTFYQEAKEKKFAGLLSNG